MIDIRLECFQYQLKAHEFKLKQLRQGKHDLTKKQALAKIAYYENLCTELKADIAIMEGVS